MKTTEAPTFTAGNPPFWRLACGCEVGALRVVRCALHAAAPEMRELIQAMLGALDDCSTGAESHDSFWNRGGHGYVVTHQARALLARVAP